MKLRRSFPLFASFAPLIGLTLLASLPKRIEGQTFSLSSVEVGQLQGKLTVQWIEPDVFLFIPDAAEPLTFVRKNGRRITPGRMLTDGGSIPRAMRVLRDYSPWGFAPAFIVHDWLFHLRHCRLNGHEDLTVEEAGRVMAEVMVTMIRSGRIQASETTVRAMQAAVTSPIAKSRWDNGKCNPPPTGLMAGEPLVQFELVFDAKTPPLL
jgi:hypothetical protein